MIASYFVFVYVVLGYDSCRKNCVFELYSVSCADLNHEKSGWCSRKDRQLFLNV